MFPSLFVCALALSAPVPKDKSIDLSWKFAKGDVFYVKHDEELELAGTVDDHRPVKMVALWSAVYQLEVTASDDKQTVLKLTFLSGNEGAAEEREQLKLDDDNKLPGKTLTFTLDAAHAVTSVKGEKKPKPAQVASAGMLEEERGCAEFKALLRAVPRKVVGESGTWASETEEKPVEDTVFKRTERGKVDGTTGGLTKLVVESELDETGGWDAKVTMHFACENAPRTVQFDAKAGRVRSVEETRTMTGVVDAIVGPGACNFHLTRTHTTKITVTDEKPKVKK